MNLMAFISLIAILICLGIAEIVYHSNKKEALNRIFALSNLGCVYFFFYYFMCQQAESVHIAYLWNKIGSFWFFVMSLFFHFVLIFTEKTKLLKKKFTYILLYIPTLIFSIIALTTDQFNGQPIKQEYGGYSAYMQPQNPGLLYYVMIIWILNMLTIGIILCFHYYFKTIDKIKKKRAGLILIGFLPLIIITLLDESLILIKIKMPELGAVGIIWLNACIGYAIWKYDLFKIDPVKAAENIITTMPDSLVLINNEGKIVEVNSSFINTFKYNKEEIIGKFISDLFNNKETVQKVLKNFLQNEIIINLGDNFITKTGRIIPILLSGSAIKNIIGQKIGAVCIIRDITELKLAEEALLSFNKKLQQSNKELQDFAYIASHDLQEPLWKIIAFGDKVKEKNYSILDDQSRDYLDRMQNASARMQNLIVDLFKYSRVTTHAEPYSSVDLNKIVKEVLSDLEISIEKSSAKIDVGPLPVIVADSTQMRQLFQNLIGNALKFHEPDKHPMIKVYVLNEYMDGIYNIVVEDNGIGIDKKNYEVIFGVFKRLHSRDLYDGSGIGLAVCKKIVERHGGKIEIESKLGEGTKFIVSLYEKINKLVDA